MLTTPDELRYVKKNFIRHVFNVGYPTITKWLPEIQEIGADNSDGTFDLIKIVQWRLKKFEKKEDTGKAGLEIKKLEADVKYREAQIEKILDNYVEKSTYEQHMGTLFRVLRDFFQKSPEFHYQKFNMISGDLAKVRLTEYGKEAMDQIAGMEDKDE